MNWLERRRRFQRRRRLLRVLLAVFGGMAVLLVAGAALPGTRTRSGQLTLERSRESVWHILTDLDGMPRWRSDITRLERLPDLQGRPAWRETGRDGARVVQLAESEPPRRLVLRRADRSTGPEWTIDLAEIPGRTGTVIRVTERESVAPLARVLTRLIAGADDPPRFLRDLARLLGTSPGQIAAGP